MIKLLLVEDNKFVRNITADLIETHGEFAVAAQADNGLSALALLENGLEPDIVLADLNMAGMDGIELTQKLSARFPDIKVIILTMHAKTTFLNKAISSGVRGYLLKNGDMNEVYDAIRRVYRGEFVVGTDVKEGCGKY
ncbi:response regulator transcription factor [Pedobacter sp. SYP-B3415]|uniref:response regulator n=1 Tax=Pedobacter sp. SYP-B3415 TaxID=2496641 RepID=UPI00101C393A|nr:response regulator transcription factor [Pedobacter sp. SYP-B3415]